MLFYWAVLNNKLFEFSDTADVQAHSLLIMIVSFYVLQISMMHYFNVAHFNIVIFTVSVALIMSHYWLPPYFTL